MISKIRTLPQQTLAHSPLLDLSHAAVKKLIRSAKKRGYVTVVPENSIRVDSRDEAESAHHPTRCLHSFSCLGYLSPTCSGRGAGLKSRTSFSGISSILL
jgi:hypothetical protein